MKDFKLSQEIGFIPASKLAKLLFPDEIIECLIPTKEELDLMVNEIKEKLIMDYKTLGTKRFKAKQKRRVAKNKQLKPKDKIIKSWTESISITTNNNRTYSGKIINGEIWVTNDKPSKEIEVKSIKISVPESFIKSYGKILQFKNNYKEEE